MSLTVLFFPQIQSKEMTDPRPFNYEYRKQRPDNRTFQSNSAYESLYHMGRVEPALYSQNFMGDHYTSRVNRYAPVNTNSNTNASSNPYSSNIGQQVHYQPIRQAESYQKRFSNVGINTDRKSNQDSSNRSVKSQSSSVSGNSSVLSARHSALSNYGSNSLPRSQVNHVNNQQHYPSRKEEINKVFTHNRESSNVFQRQQKPFNIINMYARQAEPLKKFPKLSQEHRIYEQGMDFNF